MRTGLKMNWSRYALIICEAYGHYIDLLKNFPQEKIYTL